MESYQTLKKIRETKPLIHHITNWVTIYDCANIVRAFGALPVMAHAEEEVEEMTSISNALVLNIGTLTKDIINSMIKSGKKANEKNIPIVLDAVGAGATKFRTECVNRIIKSCKIDVIKGNLGEIASVFGSKAEVKGVESISSSEKPEELVKKFAKKFDCTAVITGKIDYVSNGKKNYKISNGSEYMGQIVGTGCMAASVIGCFVAIEKDYAKASAQALSCFGIAGELAEKRTKEIGSFKTALYDCISQISEEDIKRLSKVEEYV
ncbi:MAG: hydroxyethylthiazole kinase [Candidatus Diapherotrites archaeon]|nr:hydroxyethylthiazole kinase [Candidatus Diapherotrites archaeon]